jgi:hypothetical protein
MLQIQLIQNQRKWDLFWQPSEINFCSVEYESKNEKRYAEKKMDLLTCSIPLNMKLPAHFF